MLIGIAVRSTGTSGSRNTPMAMKTAASRVSVTGSRFFNSGTIMRPITARNSPIAAHDTPVKVRCSAGICPYCA